MNKCDILKADIVQSKGWMDTDSNLCTAMNEMDYCRIYAGASSFVHSDHRIIVGGGCWSEDALADDAVEDASSRSLEIYDLHKDEWNIIHAKTNKTHRKYPLIWTDMLNDNIVYIGGD